ncbi:hypothetical protein MLD38_016171 [Melastoma candidum]|uniref:Uncharacterized protein n=1 Tax=Melastoma candidum TaxID=119954 RepID=A0ACB9RIF0_9MYRT|nr:hypothetical protein MLD38_016171 [Melastoma candidum]
MRPKFIKACLKKWRRVLRECDRCGFHLWPSTPAPVVLRDEDGSPIPRDVPKGHLAVYVGEDEKRYVIRVSVLDEPLFLALLDEAREVYDYGAESRLRIPCNEDVFVDVLRCASRGRRNICGVRL